MWGECWGTIGGRAAGPGGPASAPPAFILASRTDRSVVLPIFHRLVSRVTFPAARKPSHSQATAAVAGVDDRTASGTTGGTKKARDCESGSGNTSATVRARAGLGSGSRGLAVARCK